ncbi:MAG: hypothetical protein ABGX23_06980 [Nautiliaceae bacterium]
MKRLKLIFIISSLYASDNIILKEKTKETNNTIIEEKIYIRKLIINSFNSLLPSFLQIAPKEKFLKAKVSYDTKNKKLSTSLDLRVILPSFEKTKIKSKSTTIKSKIKTYKFKITPMLRLYKREPSFVIKPYFSYRSEYKNFITLYSKNITFKEYAYFYTPQREYKEITSLNFDKPFNKDNLSFVISKTYLSTQKSNLFYSLGWYFTNTNYKSLLRIYGFTINGERKKLPFFYSYKLFFTYRHNLFNKNYLFWDFTPYLLVSKEYHFSPKPFLNVSLNLNF